MKRNESVCVSYPDAAEIKSMKLANKLLIMQSFPTSCHFLPLRSKYSALHPVLKDRQSTFFTQCERPCFTPTQNNTYNYGSVHLNLRSLEYKTFWSEWQQF